MKEIKLSQRNKTSKYNHYVAMVDDEDFEYITKFKWHLRKTGKHLSARRWIAQGNSISMHREILKMAKDDNRVVDHKDHNPLNNQKDNLRICNTWQNNVNRMGGGKSTFLGVGWNNKTKMWMANIKIDGRQRHLGTFEYEDDAAKCYDRKAKELYGEFANLNFKPQ